MGTVQALLGEQWIIGVVQLLLGGLMKQALKDKLLAAGQKATSLIPLLNLLIAYLGFQILPTTANAAAYIASIVPIREGLSVFSLALLQTLLITGTHSSFKNTVVPALKTTGIWLIDVIKPLFTR